jgi:integrase
MLTAQKVKAVRYDPAGGGKQVIYDGGELPGFGLRVYPSGRKSYVLRYRLASGRTRDLTLGATDVLSLAQARQLARDALLAIRQGEDPTGDRRDARQANTVADLCDMYIDRHSKPNKRTSRDDERRVRVYVKPALGTLAVADVTRVDVARLHTAIGERKAGPAGTRTGRGRLPKGGGKVEANRVAALLSNMFEKARDWGMLDEGAPNPARRVERYREQSRERYVTVAEMPRLFAALEAETSPYARAAIEMLLLTALRRSELTRLRWRDVDFDERVLRLTLTKNGKAHTVPLPQRAIELLHGLPKMLHNEHVFPGSGRGKPMDLAKVWQRVRDRAELTDVRLHDLRRTVGSWLASSGNGLPVVGRLLNHQSTATTAIYAKVADVAVRDAVDQHAERLRAVVERAQPA